MEVNPQPPTAAGAAAGSAVAERLRRSSFGAVCALLVQYGLGMGVNLFVNVPDADRGKGIGHAFGASLSGGPAALAAHAGVGLLLVVNVIVVFVIALRTRRGAMIVSSALGLLCVIGAAFSGAAFVDKDSNGSSMTMAVLTGVAIACYTVNLYVLGARRD